MSPSRTRSRCCIHGNGNSPPQRPGGRRGSQRSLVRIRRSSWQESSGGCERGFFGWGRILRIAPCAEKILRPTSRESLWILPLVKPLVADRAAGQSKIPARGERCRRAARSRSAASATSARIRVHNHPNSVRYDEAHIHPELLCEPPRPPLLCVGQLQFHPAARGPTRTPRTTPPPPSRRRRTSLPCPLRRAATAARGSSAS